MRLGIFGGTFDPVHNGHVECVLAMRESFSLDEVFFVPSKNPVHKQGRSVAAAEDRAKMLELALEGLQGLELSRIEIDRDTPSYSVLTVKAVRQQNAQADVFFILGVDAFNELRTWRDYTDLLHLASFIILPRNGQVADPGLFAMSDRMYIADIDDVDISSSEVRTRIALHQDITGMVPEAVAEYIESRRLYTA